MAAPLTVLQIINIAKVSQYLATIDIAKGSLWGGRLSPSTPRVLYMERKAVEWLYNLDPNNSTLPLTANYLYSLCRGYNLKARSVTGSGGSISPVVPGTMPNPIEFIVSGSSYIPTGGSVKTITTFIGWNLLFIRNNVAQSTVNNGGTYFNWSKTTGAFEMFGAAAEEELLQFYPF